MTRVLPRTHFHRSELIRCLADLAMLEVVEPGNAFAEKLGLWIHFTDAITLCAVHGEHNADPPEMPPEEQPVLRVAAGIEFNRTRDKLIDSIVTSCSPGLGKAHLRLPEPNLELPTDIAAAYAPYRRFYDAHQRAMELRIQALRGTVREVLAKASPRLRKLAELDATLEKILGDRERQLLSKVPAHLKKHFEQLVKTHQKRLVESQAESQAESQVKSQVESQIKIQPPDNPAGQTQAGAWLARFCNDMQILLLAEVELRLQPALGLIEAMNQNNYEETRNE